MKRVIGAATFALGMALNPAAFWGCGDGDQPVHNFGEPEMLALLGAVQESSGWQDEDPTGATYLVEVDLVPSVQPSPGSASALFAKRAHACGTRTRTFGASAAACFDVYETRLPVTGAVTVSRASGDVVSRVGEWQVSGALIADGLDLSQAHVYVDVRGEGVQLRLSRRNGVFALGDLRAGEIRLWE